MLTNPEFSSFFDNQFQQRRQKKQRIGTIYNLYRITIAIFFSINFFIAYRSSSQDLWHIFNILPTFGYLLVGILLFVIYFFYAKDSLLLLGLVIDVLVLSVALYFSGGSDLQIALMFLVVVSASFMLVKTSQASLLTLFAITLVVYQQFFHAISTSFNLGTLNNALFMSLCFIVVAYLTHSISKRLKQIELLSARQTNEVNALNAINQQVVKIIEQGVMVITHQLEILIANDTALQQLMLEGKLQTFDLSTLCPKLAEQLSPLVYENKQEFIFKLQNPCLTTKSVAHIDYRIHVTQLGRDNDYVLLLIEDLRREQSHAQQLKLASLGQLTASIAHEIRNPLAAISQASQLLLEETTDPDSGLSEDNAVLYEMIYKQTIRVNQIIEDVLKLSRQESPNQILINPKTWLPKFIEENFSNQNIFLHCQSENSFWFDVRQLEQVLVNLIKNGLRFSSKIQDNPYVTLDIYELGKMLHIDVIDTGTGVKPENIQYLFNPFFTTDNQGTGLGLYLSQAFCQANQAHLQYIANHQHTCFRISCLMDMER